MKLVYGHFDAHMVPSVSGCTPDSWRPQLSVNCIGANHHWSVRISALLNWLANVVWHQPDPPNCICFRIFRRELNYYYFYYRSHIEPAERSVVFTLHQSAVCAHISYFGAAAQLQHFFFW